jgi:molybdopterin-binding protein
MSQDVPDDALRIGQAAALLGVSVDTIRRWEDEGRMRMVRSAGGQRMVGMSEVQRLLAQRPRTQHRVAATSARNQLEAVVTNIKRDTAAASIEMQAGPYRLVALTTAESVDDLQLVAGTRVIASVKATNVIVGLPED